MAAPQTPQGTSQPGPTGSRRPRAWLARRMAAILSTVAVLGLGGLMYWNDHQSSTAQAATAANTSSPSNPANSSNSSNSRVYRSGDDEGESEHEDDGEDDDEHEDDGERESESDDSSVDDDITRLIPGLSDSTTSSSGTSSSGTSSSGASAPAPSPHSSTRGS